MICYIGPTCPENFFPFPPEPDGRTCYSRSSGQSPAELQIIAQSCQAADNYLQRPALPNRPDLIELLKPLSRYIVLYP